MATPNHSTTKAGRWSYSVVYNPYYGYNNVSNADLGAVTFSTDVLTVSSVNTPGFKFLKKKDYPFNPYTKVWNTMSDSGSLVQAAYEASNGRYYGTYTYRNSTAAILGGLASIPSVTAEDPYQKAVNQIMETVKLGKTNSGVTLAEAHKTAAMVASTATRIYKSVKALRSADLGSFTAALGITTSPQQTRRFMRSAREAGLGPAPFKWSKDPVKGTWSRRKGFKPQPLENRVEEFAAKTWLEYTYGWRPLLSDIHSSAEALASLMVEKSNTVRYASASSSNSKSKFATVSANQLKHIAGRTETRSVKIKVAYRIPLGAVSVANTFGLNNPAVVAWELVPFSFVADWFLPIGTALEALTAYEGLEFVGGSVSRRTTSLSTVAVVPGASYTTGGIKWVATSCSAFYSAKTYSYSRSGLSSFPPYGFPQLKNPASVSHATSAIALLKSLWKPK